TKPLAPFHYNGTHPVRYHVGRLGRGDMFVLTRDRLPVECAEGSQGKFLGCDDDVGVVRYNYEGIVYGVILGVRVKTARKEGVTGWKGRGRRVREVEKEVETEI